MVRWKGWIAVFSALTLTIALLTWNGWISFLPVIGTIAGTIGYWTNNAKKIRLANLVANSPCMLAYDALVGSWGGVLNESVIMISIVISILRFGWKALDRAEGRQTAYRPDGYGSASTGNCQMNPCLPFCLPLFCCPGGGYLYCC